MKNEAQTFNFGKYKGRLVESLIYENFNYVYWVVNNVKWFELSKRNLELFKKQKQLVGERPRLSRGPVDIDFDEWDSMADCAPY